MSEKVADCNDINRADRIRILEQCDDLECLLLNVVQTEKLLREDVQDALIKDIEEGILSQELTSKVIDEEQHLCNRSDYMQFCIGKRGAHGDIQNRKLKLCSWENAIQNALWNFSAIPDILIPLSPLMQSHFVGKKEYLEEDVRLYFEDFFTPVANTEMKTRPSFHVFINGTLIIAAPDPGDKQSRLRFSNEINSLENILTTEMCNKFSQVQSAQDLYTYLSNNEIVSELFHRELNRFSGRSCVITLVRVQDLNEIPKLTPKLYSQLLRGYIMNGRLCGIEQAFAHVYDEVLVCEENQNSSFAQEIQREAFNFCKTFVKQIHTQALENAKQDACEASGPVVNGEVDGLEKSICDQISSLSIVVLFFYTNNARKEEATDLNSNRVTISLFHAELIEPNLHESHFFSWSDLAGARQVSLHQSHRYAELDDSNTSTSTTSNVQTFKCKDALPPFRFCPNVEQSRVISPCNVLCRFLLQYIMKPQVRNHTYVSDWKMRYCCIAIAIGIFVFKQAYSKTK